MDGQPNPESGAARVTVRVFGLLREVRLERGLLPSAEAEVPEDGITAGEIADELGLPRDLIEGVFCNHTVYGLGHVIRPGDRVAFVPYGTPGPHRVTLGLYDAGRGQRE